MANYSERKLSILNLFYAAEKSSEPQASDERAHTNDKHTIIK